MSRVVRLTPRFLESAKRLPPRESAQTARELGRLGSAASLPLAGDYEAMLPPTATVWVRRVPQSNVWVLYTWGDAEVRALRVLRSPPVPLDP